MSLGMRLHEVLADVRWQLPVPARRQGPHGPWLVGGVVAGGPDFVMQVESVAQKKNRAVPYPLVILPNVITARHLDVVRGPGAGDVLF